MAFTTADLSKISFPISFGLVGDWKPNCTLILHIKQIYKEKLIQEEMAGWADVALFASYCYRIECVWVRTAGLWAPWDLSYWKEVQFLRFNTYVLAEF